MGTVESVSISLYSLKIFGYKKIVLSIGCILLGMMTFAQTGFQDLSFKEALEKAKTEDKLVFMDCYTTWCDLCKMMIERARLGGAHGVFRVCLGYTDNAWTCHGRVTGGQFHVFETSARRK